MREPTRQEKALTAFLLGGGSNALHLWSSHEAPVCQPSGEARYIPSLMFTTSERAGIPSLQKKQAERDAETGQIYATKYWNPEERCSTKSPYSKFKCFQSSCFSSFSLDLYSNPRMSFSNLNLQQSGGMLNLPSLYWILDQKKLIIFFDQGSSPQSQTGSAQITYCMSWHYLSLWQSSLVD